MRCVGRAVTLWCAALVVQAAGYTVDCNHEYTDCDTEISKIHLEDEDSTQETITPQHIILPNDAESMQLSDTATLPERHKEKDTPKPEPRLINLNVEDLQKFANSLHNDSVEGRNQKKVLHDLSDVNLDNDEEDSTKSSANVENERPMPDKFYSNLEAPFNPLMTMEIPEDTEVCKENGVAFKAGERIERGCEETCECTINAVFDCVPRCKHPYIRRGRRLNDPMCFETPVDECCSILACTTNSDSKVTGPACKHGNETHAIGAAWNVGCEKVCKCEKNSIVNCRPRCNPLPQSDKCINVQDPNDSCCEIQVCDVSHDAHEEPMDNSTSSATNITTNAPITAVAEEATESEEYLEIIKQTQRPLVLTEPIGSVVVLQNNSVQVNLMHLNHSEAPIHLLLSEDGGRSFKDVLLEYSNLILNLKGGKDYILKTKETGTKFNFTITSTGDKSDTSAEKTLVSNTLIGCHQDGKFYTVGEEFLIGCKEICECTGLETRECANIECPSHVGLELVSKGCVRWAPSPPAQPPNCCPRAARCLSDGTCHYKGIAIPNWSEVPIALTGCEERCFCENGDLDCQEICSPLPELPPQTLRCPLMYRPAPVNVSDEDCCKQWGCVPNTGYKVGPTSQNYSMPYIEQKLIVSTISPSFKSVLQNKHVPPPIDYFYRHLNPAKTIPKYFKPVPVPRYTSELKPYNNISIFDLANDSPMYNSPSGKPELLSNNNDDLLFQSTPKIEFLNSTNDLKYNVDESEFKTKFPSDVKPDHENKWKFNKAKTTTSQTSNNDNLWASDQKYGDDYYEESKKTKQANIEKPLDNSRDWLFQPKETFVSTESILSPMSIDDNWDYRPKKIDIPIPLFNTGNDANSDFNIHSQNHYNNINMAPKPFNKIKTNEINNFRYFPTSNDKSLLHKNKYNDDKVNNNNFVPSYSGSRSNLPTKSVSPEKITRLDSSFRHSSSLGKHVTLLRTKDVKNIKTAGGRGFKPSGSRSLLWHDDSKSQSDHTVLLRAIPHADLIPSAKRKTLPSSTGRISQELNNLISQFQESKPSKNLQRSADKSNNIETADHATMSPDFATSNAPRLDKPFLPTVLPDIHFPQEPIDFPDINQKLTVLTLDSDSPTSIKMLFGLPPALVGLRGSIDLRYTDTADEDILLWNSQVFAPADEILTTSRLEFRLSGLKPSTTYKLKAKLYLHNLPVEPESDVRTVRTIDLPTISEEEKRREIDSRLTVVDVNDTTAHVSWRHFTEDELQYIDGIQVRYRPVGTPIYLMTELLHHSRSTAYLQDLRPSSKYEASLVLIPPPRSLTELHDPQSVEFSTSPYVDPYNWSVTIEARAVGSEAAELSWRGVPSPAERWVRVYRAAHACQDDPRRENDAFRLAARDLSPVVTLTGLKPDTRCRVWLELFLTNGKVKTSNVLEITTKSLDSPEPIDKAATADGRGAPRSDYYGALVVVGVVAALGAVTSLLLLLVVVRRHRPRSVPITPVPSAPRESSLPPYDNPAYKLELQQETMDL